MTVHHSLRRNFAWTLVGNIVFAACQWAIIIVLNKIGSIEMVGQYSLALAITAPIFMLTNLQLRSVQATDAKEQYNFEDYLSLRFITSVLALFIVLAVIILQPYTWTMILIIGFIAILKTAESFSDVFHGLFQLQERMDIISRALIMKGLLSLVLLTSLLLLTHQIVASISGLIIAWLVIFIFYETRLVKKRSMIHLNWSNLKSLIKLSLPLGITMMLISLTDTIPKYFIEKNLGLEELGYYSSIANLILIGNTLVGALGQAASPRLAKYYANNELVNFRNLIIKMLCFGVLIGIIGICVVVFLGKPLLSIIYTQDYVEYIDLFIWLMIIGSINYLSSFLGYGMTSARYFRVQPYVFVLLIIVSSILLLLWVPIFGLYGVVYSLLITSICQFAASFGINIHALMSLKNKVRDGDCIVDARTA